MAESVAVRLPSERAQNMMALISSQVGRKHILAIDHHFDQRVGTTAFAVWPNPQ